MRPATTTTVRRSRLHASRAAGLLAAALCLPAFAGGDYTFVNIADNTGPLGNSFFQPAINNNGRVAFGAGIGGGETGVFTGDGGPLTPIALGDDTNFNVSYLIAMNDNDTVAVRVSESVLEEGIWTGNGGPLTLVVVNDDNPYSSCSLPDINTPGQVVFHAFISGGTTGLYRAHGFGNYTTIADTTA